MKGNVEDIVIVGVIIFALAISTMLGYLVLNEFYGAPPIAGDPVASGVVSQGLSSLVVFGNAFIFLTIGFGIAAGISAFYTETHPVFFIFSVMMFSILMLIIGVLSEVFVEFSTTGVMLPVANQFTLMVALMVDFPIIAVLLAAIIFLGLYAKRSDLQGQRGMA